MVTSVRSPPAESCGCSVLKTAESQHISFQFKLHYRSWWKGSAARTSELTAFLNEQTAECLSSAACWSQAAAQQQEVPTKTRASTSWRWASCQQAQNVWRETIRKSVKGWSEIIVRVRSEAAAGRSREMFASLPPKNVLLTPFDAAFKSIT